ncbi:class I SAM-dependent methyltransferase [Oleiagrimonas soli]|uniref:SAM-dependent methyltransferase n=1 Tax=Oleiagrimonas soli TaxID=1543381 RepID=A0A099CZQ6_9GAMM|nr:class I SAM-dependent methyltransferase [Oleiagrimonas soli]KGI79047.1 SAM-dependent methyltransferase [Oleiagrimonas soli]MBB6184584.1 ubiquinone/menaquinone biosynthesis C-methylase UbiE [Oleiagrimonas soli]
MNFKDHFSGHAALYRQARPVYPSALFDWLAEQAPDTAQAWDAGCGNGQVAVALAERFARVTATDPSAEQVAQAAPHARIDYRVEPAEQCSLGDASADLVTVGQALHWFDFARFFAEVRRVLKPGGLFAAWTYADCHVTPVIDVLKNRVYADLTAPYWPPERRLVESGYADIPMPLEPVQAPPFAMQMTWTADQFLAYLRSWSGSQRYRKATGEDAVATIETELRQAWGDADATRAVRWDFHVLAGRRPA